MSKYSNKFWTVSGPSSEEPGLGFGKDSKAIVEVFALEALLKYSQSPIEAVLKASEGLARTEAWIV